MENDHLADCILFLRSALSSFADGRPVGRYDIEGAIREAEAELEARTRLTALLDEYRLSRHQPASNGD